MSQNTAGREASSQRRVTVEGVCVQLPLRVERGERLTALPGVRSGGGNEEGWLRVDTMLFVSDEMRSAVLRAGR